jgi:hypothetical protein
VNREKTYYQGSLGMLSLPAQLKQSELDRTAGTLTIGDIRFKASFPFTLNAKGRGKSTGLPMIEFNVEKVEKRRFKFKAQRTDLTDVTENLGGAREFGVKIGKRIFLRSPAILQIGTKIFLFSTFEYTYQQVNEVGKGVLNR